MPKLVSIVSVAQRRTLLAIAVVVGIVLSVPVVALPGSSPAHPSTSAAVGGSQIEGQAPLAGASAAAAPSIPAFDPSSGGFGISSAMLPATPAGSLLNSDFPATQAPWLRSLAGQGPHLKPLTSLPNFGILTHSEASSKASVHPYYVSQPAPLGLTDYGLGATTYSYNTSHFLGEITLYSPPNATDPGSLGEVEPGGAHLGAVGNLYEFGLQLNTVATNISIPGQSNGTFWTQNVVDWNDTGIHFVDDTFNVSGLQLFVAGGTIYSGCGNNTAGVNEILAAYGGVFQCVGGTLPVSPASYPVTLQLFNNATVNAQNRSQVAYGYRLVEAGTDTIYTGVSDVVVFNSPGAPGHAPPHSPGFAVDGFAPTSSGLLKDAELDLVGDIGGDNAVFRSLNATGELEFSNSSLGGWQSVPSAYNFGSDTGETATGIADYWVSNHTLVLHEGPSMLYGLWNAVPSLSVASGYLHLSGTITPSYGFVFVSNTPPELNPFASGAPGDNLSWLPTNGTGAFDTYLPPLGSPWTSGYYVQGLAAGSATTNGANVVGNTTGYSLVLPSAAGSRLAPLYAFSSAQAAELAANVSTSSTPPYLFANQGVAVNASFDHLNDYEFPSFELFMFQGVTPSVAVSNLTEGQDSAAGNFYLLDHSSGGSLLFPPPSYVSRGAYTSEINIYGGTNDRVSNLTLKGNGNQGGAVVLWEDQHATVTNVVSLDFSQGVWIGDSKGTTVRNLSVTDSTGVQDLGSSGTAGTNLTVAGGVGVVEYSSSNASYSDLLVGRDSGGVEGGAYYQLNGFSAYYDLEGTRNLTVDRLTAGLDAIGVALAESQGGLLANLSGQAALAPLELEGTSGFRVSNLTSNDSYFGIAGFAANGTHVDHLRSTGGTDGILLEGGSTGNVITQSGFVDAASAAILFTGAMGNLVYDNAFIGNNGSTAIYSSAHPQASSSLGNSFNSSGEVGNYWADWHSYVGGHLAPYPVSSGVWDYHPLGSSPGPYPVIFEESGLGTGTKWSVGVAGQGAAVPTTSSSLLFGLSNGTYNFTAGSECFAADPASGTFAVVGAGVNRTINFSPSSSICVSLLASMSGLVGYTGASFVLNFTVPSGVSHVLYVWGLGDNFTVPTPPKLPAGLTVEATTGSNGSDLGIAWGSLLPGTYTTNLTYAGYTNGEAIAVYGIHNDEGYYYSFGAGRQKTELTLLAGATVYVGAEGTGGTVPVLNSSLTTVDVATPALDGGDATLIGSQATNTLSFTTSAVSYGIVGVALHPGTPVEFEETGLPTGKVWAVTMSGLTTLSTANTIFFGSANGTFAYLVQGPAGYRVEGSAPFGNLTVSSGPVLEPVHFSRGVTYSMTFLRTGLPRGTSWCVTVASLACSSLATITLRNLTPGTYPYSTSPLPGYTTTLRVDGLPSSPSGWISLTTRGAVFGVHFTQVTYTVTFTETGLPAGRAWSVRVRGLFDGVERTELRSSEASTLLFQVPNGSFLFGVLPLYSNYGSGFYPITINGSPASVSVTFNPLALPSLPLSPISSAIAPVRWG